MDVIIMAGIYDLQDPVDTIVKNILRLYGDILEHNHHSTITVLPVMLPPAVAWLPGDGPLPADHNNHLEKLLELNKTIMLFNKDHAKHARSIISMEREGVRCGPHKDTDGKLRRGHIWSAWDGYSADNADTRCSLWTLTEKKKVAAFNRILLFIKNEITKE